MLGCLNTLRSYVLLERVERPVDFRIQAELAHQSLIHSITGDVTVAAACEFSDWHRHIESNYALKLDNAEIERPSAVIEYKNGFPIGEVIALIDGGRGCGDRFANEPYSTEQV